MKPIVLVGHPHYCPVHAYGEVATARLPESATRSTVAHSLKPARTFTSTTAEPLPKPAIPPVTAAP